MLLAVIAGSGLGLYYYETKTLMIAKLQLQTKMVIKALAAQEATEALAREIEKPAKPQEAVKRKKELTESAEKKIEERIGAEPELKKTITARARDETAKNLAESSAAILCFFISRYIYYRAINCIGADVSFPSWFKTQLRRGHAGKSGGGAPAFGKGGSHEETRGLQEYPALDEIPSGVRLAISKQLYREWSDKDGKKHESEHFLLVFKDDDGHWRNLDHVTMSKPWHGELTDPKSVRKLFCVPTMTAAEAAPASAPKPASPSLPVEVTPKEQRLQQCFQQIAAPAVATPVENPNSHPSP